MRIVTQSVRNAPVPGAVRRKARLDRFSYPIGSPSPGQGSMRDGTNKSEWEADDSFNVADMDRKKIDLSGKAGRRRLTEGERRRDNHQPVYLDAEEDESGTGPAGDGSVSSFATDEKTYLQGNRSGEAGQHLGETSNGGVRTGADTAPQGSGTDAAYRDLLLRQAAKDPRLYSNPTFIRELENSEQRMKRTGIPGTGAADSYCPERYWREAVGSVQSAVQNGLNALSTLGREVQAGQYASSAMDQRFFGKLSGKEDYYDRADSLMDLSVETADRILEPVVDFGSRYREETEELYPYSGPAQRFLNRVISGGASMAPSVVGNLLLPGSGLYVNMLQSLGGAMTEAKERGADDSTVLAYGASVGIAETLLEKLVDGMGGLFGKGILDETIGDEVRRAAMDPAAREALIYMGGMVGEGFEEFLSVFANELLNVHMLGSQAQTWEALLDEAGLSFFASALVSGLFQGASMLGDLVASGADELTVEDLGKLLAEEVEAKLRESPEASESQDPSLEAELEAAVKSEQLDNDHLAVDNSAEPGYNEKQRRKEQVRFNYYQGKLFEDEQYPQFAEEYYFTERQITIVMPSGMRVRVDAIGLDVDGNVVIIEYKSSETAPPTKNQKQGFAELLKSGGFVVGQGKGFFYGGTDIPPKSGGTKIIIQRPGHQEVL